MMQAWTSRCELTTKKGEKVPLLKAMEMLDEIDFTKPAHVYVTENSRTCVKHDLLLLSLSADKYPVVIESLAREMRKALNAPSIR